MKKVIKCTHCNQKIGSNYCHWHSDVPKCDDYYCSLSCASIEHSIQPVCWLKCEKCEKIVNTNAVIDKSGSIYCSFECALSANGVEIIKQPVQRCCTCGSDGAEKYFKRNGTLFCDVCAVKVILEKLEKNPNCDISNQTITQALKTLGFEEVVEDDYHR